jgi:hypothetical protein
MDKVEQPTRIWLGLELSKQCDAPAAFQPNLSKAEASNRVDTLKAKRKPVLQR